MNAIRHESWPVESHWAKYVAANAANNIGAAIERELAAAGTSETSFSAQVNATMDAVLLEVGTATDIPEPHEAWRDVNGTFLGFVNFATYGPGCNP